MKLTPEQRAAQEAARLVVPPVRAQAIRRLKSWEQGGCLVKDAARPDVEPVTPEEDQAIRQLWETLPGWTSWMTALNLLAHR